MDQNTEAAVPEPRIDRTPTARLSRTQLESLATVCDPLVSERDRDLIDARYPWQPRTYYPHPALPGVIVFAGIVIAAFGSHPFIRFVGALLASVSALTGLAPSAVLWFSEHRLKRRYDSAIARSVPVLELEAIAEEQPELGALICRTQRAVDEVNDSEAHEQELLNGVVALSALAQARYDLVVQIVDLAAERALLAQADGRPSLEHLLRDRRDAAGARLAAITASVEQLEAIRAEVALLDEHLADLRIAEQILGAGSLPMPDPTSASRPGGIEDAAAGVRAMREFVIQHHLGGSTP